MSSSKPLLNNAASTAKPATPVPWADIPGFVAAFEDCTLPKEQWTHVAHLTVAHHYLWHHSRQEATHRMRTGIQRYNSSHGNLSGYHETITMSWLAIIAREIDKRRPIENPPFDEKASMMEIAAACGDQNLLLDYYTHDRLMSTQARARWVRPDIREIE